VGCGGGDIDTDANGRKLRARNDCLVGGETLGVDAYVELGGDHSAIRLAVYVMISIIDIQTLWTGR
jgi:hypothetical protein